MNRKELNQLAMLEGVLAFLKEKLMKPYKTGNPTLFGEYTNVRSVVDIPAGRGKQTIQPGKIE